MTASTPASPLHVVELQCHGYPSLRINGRAVELKLRRGLALVAFLGETRKRCARTQLAELLWPDAPADIGRARLRRVCHEINAAVGHPLLSGDVDTVALDLDAIVFDSDVDQVRRAAHECERGVPSDAALACLCRADAHQLLFGFEIESEVFGDWLRARRAELERTVARALGQAAQHLLAAGRAAPATACAEALIRLDALSDVGHALLIGARSRLGDAAGVEAAYFDCAELMRAELGARPSASIEAAYQDALRQLARPPQDAAAPGADLLAPIRFADSCDGSVAFLELGARDAPAGTLVILFGLWSNVELSWEEPRIRAMLERLAQRFHVVLMDRRGTGLSERLDARFTVEAGAQDVDAVLDALGVREAWLFGNSFGGTILIEYAATRARRVRGLVLYAVGVVGMRTDDYPWALQPDQLAQWLERLLGGWGGATSLAEFSPAAAEDPAARAWWARTLRQSASRHSIRSVLRAFGQTDVRRRLRQLAVPTLVVQREDDRIVRAAVACYIAERVAEAELVMLPGQDHLVWYGDTGAVLDALERFVQARLA
jgi:pimeloyl-ACP methyl ester carboxylesterase